MSKGQDVGILILRVSLGFMMLLHGISKIKSGVGFIEAQLGSSGFPKIMAYGVYVGEVLAPLLIILGFRTRIAAAIFLFNCVMAVFLVHSADIFSLGKHGGWAIELLGLYSMGALSLLFSGGGKIALSHKSQFD